MKLNKIVLLNSCITASVVIDSLESAPVYETVTVTSTWVPPDINQWTNPAEYFATTTTEYDTEEKAEMALQRHGRKKKHFGRKKKHFKKTYHRKMMKPHVYPDQQSSVMDAFEDRNVNVMILQEGGTVIEKVGGSAW